jgi:hypothetical protein
MAPLPTAAAHEQRPETASQQPPQVQLAKTVWSRVGQPLSPEHLRHVVGGSQAIPVRTW